MDDLTVSAGPRYLVFRGDDEYMRGGWHDFVGAVDQLSTAVEIATTQPVEGESPLTGQGDWYHIVDTEKRKVVLKGVFEYTAITINSDRPLDDGSDVDGLEITVLESVTCEVVHRDDE